MADRGSFVVLERSVGGGGGGGSATVLVPDNADVLVARAADTSVTLTKLDDTMVNVSLPASGTMEDFLLAANELVYIFGAPATDELGWLTVTAKGILGMADSADGDSAPDYVPVAGTITLTPGISGVVKLLTSRRFFAVSPVTCTFDSDGELSHDGQKNVRVIAPKWSELSNTAWLWTATVQPGFGQGWAPFEVRFTGTPGSVINLADLL